MYDTIVIGRDLSSLIAALTSVQEGLRTVLIMEGNMEMVYRDAGYTFPFDSRPLSGLVNKQSFARFIRNNDASSDYDNTHIKLMNPAFQVIIPGHRVDLFHEADQLISELIREYPNEEREIRRFYHAVLKTGNLVHRWIEEDEAHRSEGIMGGIMRRLSRMPNAIASKLSLIIRSNGMDDSFRRVVQAQLNYLSHLEVENDPISLSMAYLLSLPNHGLYYRCGGLTSWMDTLRMAFENYGGSLISGCSIIRMETDPFVSIDLENEGSSSSLRGQKLIVSAQWEKLGILLSSRKILPNINGRFSSIRAISYPFCLHMGVRDESIPENMAPYVVLLHHQNSHVTDRDLAYIQTSLPEEYDRAPAGRRAISTTVYLAESPLRVSDQELKNVSMGIIDSLEDFLPFLRESIDYLQVDQSISFSRSYQETVNRKYLLRRHPFGCMNTLVPKTRIRNVFLTGGILRPGMGLEGEIMAGMDAAFQAKIENRQN
jgi:phytoene dehydrogenase-like protein